MTGLYKMTFYTNDLTQYLSQSIIYLARDSLFYYITILNCCKKKWIWIVIKINKSHKPKRDKIYKNVEAMFIKTINRIVYYKN